MESQGGVTTFLQGSTRHYRRDTAATWHYARKVKVVTKLDGPRLCEPLRSPGHRSSRVARIRLLHSRCLVGDLHGSTRQPHGTFWRRLRSNALAKPTRLRSGLLSQPSLPSRLHTAVTWHCYARKVKPKTLRAPQKSGPSELKGCPHTSTLVGEPTFLQQNLLKTEPEQEEPRSRASRSIVRAWSDLSLSL